ncbi:hypothetical protein TNCV_3566401 [Trichonephila clavipes]|nr:hypothetical protein TNCV_3566401 [Trichonephila clavipes]
MMMIMVDDRLITGRGKQFSTSHSANLPTLAMCFASMQTNVFLLSSLMILSPFYHIALNGSCISFNTSDNCAHRQTKVMRLQFRIAGWYSARIPKQILCPFNCPNAAFRC